MAGARERLKLGDMFEWQQPWGSFQCLPELAGSWSQESELVEYTTGTPHRHLVRYTGSLVARPKAHPVLMTALSETVATQS